MNLAKLTGKPLPDELIDKLGPDDLMVAYLVAIVTPAQEARIMLKLKATFPPKAA